jgi:hypothetical protein
MNYQMRQKAHRLCAELAVLVEYDRVRTAKRHDYGCGQRSAELMRRRRELQALGVDGAILYRYRPDEYVSKDELAAAFERVGRPKLRRAERETYRKHTPATSRTLEAWGMVERWATGMRAELPVEPQRDGPADPPPSSTAEGIGRALRGADYSTGPDRDETPHDPHTGRELEL